MNFLDVWRTHDFGEVARRIASKTTTDVRRALGKPRGGVEMEDFAALLSPAAAPLLEEMARSANQLTVARFGRTMRLFAPLYLSNACANVCTYCGFSAHNKIRRKVLNDAEILAEARVLRSHGFDSVLLVTGETGRVGREYLSNALRLLRPHFSGLWIEVQPLPEEDYGALAADGLSAVLVYQETYDAAAYALVYALGSASSFDDEATATRLLEDYVIQPRAMRYSVELPGVVTVPAVLIGGAALGIPGALFAVPMALIIRALIRDVALPAIERR